MTSAFAARYPAYTGFAAVLSGAGLPIYIYAPKYYADTFGVSLTALGVVLFGLRLFDVVQDPVLGWLVARLDWPGTYHTTFNYLSTPISDIRSNGESAESYLCFHPSVRRIWGKIRT